MWLESIAIVMASLFVLITQPFVASVSSTSPLSLIIAIRQGPATLSLPDHTTTAAP